MLNKEKYAKEIMDLALKHDTVALIDGKVCSCKDAIDCSKCFFRSLNCDKNFIEWANSEYKEKEIDWSKVPVDTPILVWDSDDKNPQKRHFACFEDNMIYVWSDGRTSHTINCTTHWKNAKIAEGVDCSEWYKD